MNDHNISPQTSGIQERANGAVSAPIYEARRAGGELEIPAATNYARDQVR